MCLLTVIPTTAESMMDQNQNSGSYLFPTKAAETQLLELFFTAIQQVHE